MNKRKSRIFAGDFETTVYEGQDHTEVWSSAIVELYQDSALIFHSISDQLEYFISLNSNIICYYHNLKFDGTFWLSYLLIEKNFTQAYIQSPDGTIEWQTTRDMPNNSVSYIISDMGQWFIMTIKVNNRIIEFRDSLKLLPYSLEEIGHSFGTRHKKLTMEYKGYRYAGCEITPTEEEYIKNDVYVLKEALEIMFNEGHNKLTIASCCLAEYTRIIGREGYLEFFPDLTKYEYKDTNADKWIRKSYHGGWCYLVKGKENKVFEKGITCDVNSLYPSQMHSSGGRKYPIGEPTFWEGDYIPDEATSPDKYYFIHIRTRFYLKPYKLPTIQIKSSLLYKSTEYLESSDIKGKDGNYYSHYIKNGEVLPATVDLTLTMTDYELIKEHYELVDFEIIDGCYFDSIIGIFDDYINKYKEQKLKNTGALREQAKLFLNNLYGKMASSTRSDFKVAYIKEDLTIGFITQNADKKKAGYIAIGSAITSYSRDFTIRSAQKNYYGPNQPGFIYADTDSIHCDISEDQLKGIKTHDKDFNCWKIENRWDKGIFLCAKRYIEVSGDRYLIKCAGLPTRSKKYLELSLKGEKVTNEDYPEEAVEFINKKRELTDIKPGLTIPGKLVPLRIRGGVILVDRSFKLR